MNSDTPVRRSSRSLAAKEVRVIEALPKSAENIVSQQDATTSADRSSVIPWDAARDGFAQAEDFWWVTLAPSGAPRVRPVLGVWALGALHLAASPKSAKAKDVVRDGRVGVSTSVEGLDLVVEGAAVRVTAEDELLAVADAYRKKYGWPVVVVGGAFDAPYGAPTAGAPPYFVYRIEPNLVYGFGTDEPYSGRSTRWGF